MRKTTLCSPLLLAVLFSLPIATAVQAQEKKAEKPRNKIILELEKQIAGREDEPAEWVFKNIQVLEGVPAIRVLRIMENGFSPALGVKCTFCHVKGEWDKDDKAEKQTARKMMKMVSEIRAKLVDIADEDATINCYTCHRGQVKPALSPEDEKKKRKGK